MAFSLPSLFFLPAIGRMLFLRLIPVPFLVLVGRGIFPKSLSPPPISEESVRCSDLCLCLNRTCTAALGKDLCRGNEFQYAIPGLISGHLKYRTFLGGLNRIPLYDNCWLDSARAMLTSLRLSFFHQWHNMPPSGRTWSFPRPHTSLHLGFH